MNRRSTSLSTKNMVSSSKSRSKVPPCSTPEPIRQDSPSRDSDSLCGSEAASPVPFCCTQDGAEGETDVVWNYYTPKAEPSTNSCLKNSTPLSRKAKRTIKKLPIEKTLPKRRPLRSTQKNTELYQDLLELNRNIHKLLEKKPIPNDCMSDKQSGSDDDIFNNSSSDCSPKSGPKSSSRCLRKNLLSSKFSKPEFETALESDDSMNECLIKASQIVEENVLLPPKVLQRSHCIQDSMDAILSNSRIESPVGRRKNHGSPPHINNDSFDNFVGNLNDSALERLTQMPVKTDTPVRNKSKNVVCTSGWVLQEMKVHESPSSNIFGRHSSMPESPTVTDMTKPSTSGTIFGRYNSMPYNNNDQKETGPDDSPIRCTPDEIRKKHLQAREKLLAKRQLPFTLTQNSNQESAVPVTKKACLQHKVKETVTVSAPKKGSFQPEVTTAYMQPCLNVNNQKTSVAPNDADNIKKLIEKKRQEALMKLRRKQSR